MASRPVSTLDDPGPFPLLQPLGGAEVIAFALPLSTEGVRIEETWDSCGMRGTGSHDVVVDDVFVSESQLTGRRTWGELDRPLLVTALHAFPIIYSTYLGVAEALVETVLRTGRVKEPAARAVDRMTRDVRAALYHPQPPEATLVTAGRARAWASPSTRDRRGLTSRWARQPVAGHGVTE